MILQKRAGKAYQVFNTIFFLVLSFVFLYPFWYVVIISLNDGGDALRGGIFWWPRVFTLGNYIYIFTSSDILRAYGISILRTVIGTVSSILFMALVSFGLSRRELPGRRFFAIIFLITMYINGGLVPFYLLLRDIRLLDKFWVYILPNLFSVWNMIIMRTAFRNLPESLIESAMIDGAGYYSIFLKLIIPLSKPMLAALTLFTAVGHWNDWFAGAFFVNRTELKPVQTYLQTMLSSTSVVNMFAPTQVGSMTGNRMLHATVTPVSMRMAILVAVIVPIMTVYPFLQKYFVKGALIGSLKE